MKWRWVSAALAVLLGLPTIGVILFAPTTVCQSNGDTRCRVIEGNFLLLFVMMVLAIVLAIVLVVMGLSGADSRRGE